MKPMLCRLCAYFAPGLPRPTKRRMTRHPALARDQQKWIPGLRPIARQFKFGIMIFRQTAHTQADLLRSSSWSPRPAAAFAPAAGALAPAEGAAAAAPAA